MTLLNLSTSRSAQIELQYTKLYRRRRRLGPARPVCFLFACFILLVLAPDAGDVEKEGGGLGESLARPSNVFIFAFSCRSN